MIQRIIAALPSGCSLNAACAAEGITAGTFISWMRRFGPTGAGGPGYPRKIRIRTVLFRNSDFATFGGMGTSFSGDISGRVEAVFRSGTGVHIFTVASSQSVYLDEGSRRFICDFDPCRSIEEIEKCLEEGIIYGAGSLEINLPNALAAARAAYPWLPERIG